MRLAEDSGLDTCWFGGTHFRPQRAVMASPLTGASAASPMTSRISMGLAVQVLPLANPLRGAEEEAMVDHIGGGRLIFGVGRSSLSSRIRVTKSIMVKAAPYSLSPLVHTENLE